MNSRTHEDQRLPPQADNSPPPHPTVLPLQEGTPLAASAGAQHLHRPYQVSATEPNSAKKKIKEKGENTNQTHKIMQRHCLFLRSNQSTLNKKLVLAFRVQRRLFFKRLEHDCLFKYKCFWRQVSQQQLVPETSTASPGSTRPELGRTQ